MREREREPSRVGSIARVTSEYVPRRICIAAARCNLLPFPRRKIYIDLEKDGAVGFQVIATNGVDNLTSRGVVKPVTQTYSVMRIIGVLARISM